MLLNNDIMAEGKAETRSLASGLRRKERIEHLFLHFGGDSGAIVADFDFDAVAEILVVAARVGS